MRRLLIAALVCTFPSSVFAKDLSGRVAVGVDQTIARTPALSVRFGLPSEEPTRQIQFQGSLAIDAQRDQDNTEFFVGGRVLYGVVIEDQLNLYLGTGLGGLNTPDGMTFRVQPGVSIDAFLFGLENLGFNTGLGLNIDIGQTTGIGTTGAILGGVHYWF